MEYIYETIKSFLLDGEQHTHTHKQPDVELKW